MRSVALALAFVTALAAQGQKSVIGTLTEFKM